MLYQLCESLSSIAAFEFSSSLQIALLPNEQLPGKNFSFY